MAADHLLGWKRLTQGGHTLTFVAALTLRDAGIAAYPALDLLIAKLKDPDENVRLSAEAIARQGRTRRARGACPDSRLRGPGRARARPAECRGRAGCNRSGSLTGSARPAQTGIDPARPMGGPCR